MTDTFIKKDEKLVSTFIIHTLDGNQIEVSVWDKYLEVDGECYEAAEDVCNALSGFHREYT